VARSRLVRVNRTDLQRKRRFHRPTRTAVVAVVAVVAVTASFSGWGWTSRRRRGAEDGHARIRFEHGSPRDLDEAACLDLPTETYPRSLFLLQFPTPAEIFAPTRATRDSNFDPSFGR